MRRQRERLSLLELAIITGALCVALYYTAMSLAVLWGM